MEGDDYDYKTLKRRDLCDGIALWFASGGGDQIYIELYKQNKHTPTKEHM